MTLELVFLAFSFLGLILGAFALLSGAAKFRKFGIERARSGSLPVAAFIFAFGIAGFLVSRFYDSAAMLSVPTAIAAGLGGAWLSCMIPTTDHREKDVEPSRSEIVGTVGRLSLPIRDGSLGEFVYSDGGSKRATSARSQSGRPIEKGAEVLVTRFENGVAIVRPVEDILPGVRRAMSRIGSRPSALGPRQGGTAQPRL